jgi:membrane-bound hydrogenase subunit beta
MNKNPEEIVKYFNDKFKKNIKSIEIKTKSAGSNKKETTSIWMKIEKPVFKELVKYLIEYQYPHLAVVSGNDLGKNIELIYHFTVNFGKRLEQVNLNISVEIPKSKPEIDTICDLIPGALITEREKQEMLGVKVKGIPDDRKLFLPDDWPDDIYPWRRDEKGPENYYKNLHEVNKK